MTRAPIFKRTLLASAILLLTAGQASAQSNNDSSAPASEQTVVVLGSRSVAKTALDTSSPVGLIGLKDLQTAGPLELGKLLQTLDPSFNFSSTFISDGTDSIR
jgi:iron complex outermembrane receptor protein